MRITVFYDHIKQACRQTGRSLSEIAPVLIENGISGVELDAGELAGRPGRLIKRLRECGLPVQCVYRFFDWGNQPGDRSYKKFLKKLSRYGIRNVLAVPGFVADGQDREAYRERMAVRLEDMCRYAGKLGIRVFMEDFDDRTSVYATGKEVRWFLDRVPLLGCAFDTGNFLYSEEDAKEQLLLLRDRIGYVHCKDRSFVPVDGEDYKETVSGRKMYSAFVGSGVIPMEELVGELLASGYEGTFAIEHFGSLKQLEDMTASAAWLKEQFSKYTGRNGGNDQSNGME